jgi:intracellular sulfur oxidation DsrE/DsrF family protein
MRHSTSFAVALALGIVFATLGPAQAGEFTCASGAATDAAGTTTAAPCTAVAAAPKVVFQINDGANAPTILRFVTNYLKAEPSAKVAVVGYGSGIDFMLKNAKDPEGAAYTPQLQALAAQGVAFKVCNNTLRARNLGVDAVASEASVVPGAVNEIIRLETREGYAYFNH